MLLGVSIGAVLAVVVMIFLRSVGARASPAEQLKAISDAKKAQLTRFLEGKGSNLTGFHATMADETDVDQRVDFPYLGTITFSYAVTRPEGPSRSQLINEAAVRYRDARREMKWVEQGLYQTSGGGPFEPKDLLVRFAEVKEAFEE